MDGSDFRYDLFTMEYEGRIPKAGPRCYGFRLPMIKAGDKLLVNLNEAKAWLNGTPIECSVESEGHSRKFVARTQLVNERLHFARLCSHYLPFTQKTITRDYYFGDDYTDYPLHTNPEYAVQLVRQYCSSGRVLDVGCALGIYTKSFLEAGFDAYGLDISEFAISEASKRVGAKRVKQCNLDVFEIPFEEGFDAVWMWDVLEHFVDPYGALAKVTMKTREGGRLFLRTSNADSLTHRLLGGDWEGYTDYSHHGLERVTPASLKLWLKQLGWTILKLDCNGIWVFGMDPVVLALREAFKAIPELATLLTERELGDDLLVVAIKEKQPSAKRMSADDSMRECT
jgi:2-polyprenyl-3-methyl-5-hydroxy-6-metoxy-1,4-benzoquinol methylase